MSQLVCPHCNSALQFAEVNEGRCGNCKNLLPAQPVPWVLTDQQRLGVVGLSLLFLASLFLPFGFIAAVRLGFAKGDSVCDRSGCTQPATKTIQYSGSTSRGFCTEHARNPPAAVSRNRLRFPMLIAAFGGIMAFCYVAEAFTILAGLPSGRWLASRNFAPPGQEPTVWSFALLTLVIMLVVNPCFYLVALYC
jgi:hypothetical protein